MLKDFIVPITTAVVMGVGATYFTLQTTVATVEVRLASIESEVKNLRLTYEILADIRVKKAMIETKLDLHIEQTALRDLKMDSFQGRLIKLESNVQ